MKAASRSGRPSSWMARWWGGVTTVACSWGRPTLHGEMDALENAGRLPADTYRRATIYTTLSPCDMCSGAILLYGIPRVVIGENRTFLGAEEHLAARGVEIVVRDDERCVAMMTEFIAEHPRLWNEDIGED